MSWVRRTLCSSRHLGDGTVADWTCCHFGHSVHAGCWACRALTHLSNHKHVLIADVRRGRAPVLQAWR